MTDGPAGTPVLLLHGQPGSRRDWFLVEPLLGGLTVLAPDRPGYDGAGPAGGFWENARWALDRLAEVSDAPAVIGGYSWAGGVALAAALLAPDRVAGLLLVSAVGTRAALTPADRWLAGQRTGAAVATGLRLMGVYGLPLMIRASGSRLAPAVRQQMRENLRTLDMTAAWRSWLIEQQRMVLELPALEARLGEVRAPAVVLAGRHDRMVPPQASRDLAWALPAGRYREVDAGHLLPMERPDVVVAAVRSLLGPQPTRT